jgi:hypothetical protein
VRDEPNVVCILHGRCYGRCGAAQRIAMFDAERGRVPGQLITQCDLANNRGL